MDTGEAIRGGFEEEFVVRRVTRHAVVVAAVHPIVGPVFWDFTDESDVNMPDHYGLATDIESAQRFQPGRVPYGQFFGGILESNVGTGWEDDSECGPCEVAIPRGDFANIAARVDGVSATDLLSWFHLAVWLEFPAPPTIRFVSDFNGFLGYRAEWTDDPDKATRFSRSELDDKDELDSQMAHALGEIVPVATAMDIGSFGRPGREVNHALEADFAWTLHRLQIGNWQERHARERLAYRHAALAGRAHALSGGTDEISGHIRSFPELLGAFNTGLALQRSFDAQQGAPNTPRMSTK